MRTIRIGTRQSELALWQANLVKQKLEALGYVTSLVPVKSDGDVILDKPLYQMGITGIFTKTLDIALLEERVDIAVHSMKDVPTALPAGLSQFAVLERGNVWDVLLYRTDLSFLEQSATIASGSLRRKAQWLNRYPQHNVENIRGNVNSRMQKFADTPHWSAVIFAAAGLERLEKKPANSLTLDWLVPAPAQGAIMVVGRQDDVFTAQVLAAINHAPTATCVKVERDFLRLLEGGCTAPIGAYAQIKNNELHFVGNLCATDGSKKVSVEQIVPLQEAEAVATYCADYIKKNGGNAILQALRGA